MEKGGSPIGGGETIVDSANNSPIGDNATTRSSRNITEASNIDASSTLTSNPGTMPHGQSLHYISPTQPYQTNTPGAKPINDHPLTEMPTPDLGTLNPRPISTGKGDIILNPAAETKKAKRAKRAPLIILAISIAVSVVAVIGFFTYRNLVPEGSSLFGGTSPASMPTSFPTGALADFNSYANYILYGTDSTENITGDEAADSYTYDYNKHIYNGPNTDQKYFNNIYQKYNTFYDSFRRGNPNVKSGELYDAITDYKYLLDFLKINPSSDTFSSNKIRDAYLESGEEAAYAQIDKILNLLPDNNPYSEEFSRNKTTEFNQEIDYLNGLSSAGCIIDQSIDSKCALDYYLSEYGESSNSDSETEDTDNEDSTYIYPNNLKLLSKKE